MLSFPLWTPAPLANVWIICLQRTVTDRCAEFISPILSRLVQDCSKRPKFEPAIRCAAALQVILDDWPVVCCNQIFGNLKKG